MKQFLEAGEILNTHGVRGELKVRSFCDRLSDFLSLKTVYLDEKPLRVLSSRPHKGFALVLLDGIDTIEKAGALKNRVLFLSRSDLSLKEGAVFLQDMLGFSVFDERLGKIIGEAKDVLPLPKGDLLSVKGEGDYLIPLVPEFLREIDVSKKLVRVRTIEGMLNEI